MFEFWVLRLNVSFLSLLFFYFYNLLVLLYIFYIIHSVCAEALDVSIVDIFNCHILYVSEPTREVLKVRLIQGSAAMINHSNFSAHSAVRWTWNKAFMTTQQATSTCRLIVGHIKLWLQWCEQQLPPFHSSYPLTFLCLYQVGDVMGLRTTLVMLLPFMSPAASRKNQLQND